MDLSSKLIELIKNATGGNVAVDYIVSLVLMVIGFVLLIKGADIFVDGASKIAEKMRIPLIVIGLTIVAFGTSAPEAAVSITSACQGTAGIAVGNVIGSNIMNILLILGVSALFAKLPVKKTTLKYEIPFVAFVTLVLLGLGWLGWDLNRIDGIILAILFVLFFVYLIRLSKSGEAASDDEVPMLTEKDTVPKMILMIILGLVFIVLGSDATVAGASEIALQLGVSDRIIGLTIVAFGTSLPELVTSVTAAKKGQTDIAIGNIIGSNIFNILFVAGIAAIISPEAIPFQPSFIIDSIVAIAAAVVLGLFVMKKKTLGKAGGIVMLIMYAAYFAYLMISSLSAPILTA